MRLRGGTSSDEKPNPDTDSVTIHYRTNWPTAYIHFSLDGGKTWTVRPGNRQDEAAVCVPEKIDPELAPSSIGVSWKSTTIPVTSGQVSFVLHNGKGEWDSKPRASAATFYVAAAPGVYTLKDATLTRVIWGPPAVLVVTDLDGTLVGDPSAIAEFQEVWERQCAPRGSILVFNTGRSIESTQKLIKDEGLIPPTAVIGSVGTVISWREQDAAGRVTWAPDKEWEAALFNPSGKRGKWDRNRVCALVRPMIEKDWMHFRPEEEQNSFKISFGVRAVHIDAVIATIKQGLDSNGCSAEIIPSGHGDWFYLDVACEGAGKLQATVYVRRRLGFPAESTMTCGDSGNDILMLSGEERGLIVGNAQPGLLDWLKGHGDAGGRIYKARAKHARGIVEGLRAMKFLSPSQ